MSIINTFTIRRILILGVIGLVLLSVVPALRMLSSLSDIQTASRSVQEVALPQSRTTASMQSALQALDALQLRYLSEPDHKSDRVKEISAGFSRLKILVAKMRFGSSSEEYAAVRKTFAGALDDDGIMLPAASLEGDAKALIALGEKIGAAERSFAVLMAAHNEELSFNVRLGASNRPVSDYIGDAFVEFRAWVAQLEQALEKSATFSGTLEIDATMIGRIMKAYQSSDGETDMLIRDADKLQRRLLAMAETINRAQETEKRDIFLAQGPSEIRAFETILAQLIKHSTTVVNTSRAEVQSSLQRFQTIGADVFNLTSEIELSTTKSTERTLGDARASMEATTSLTWLSLGIIAALAPLFGLVTGYAILRPLGQIAAATESVAQGEANVSIRGAERKDEIGRMARALVVFQKNIEETQRLREEQVERDQQNALVKAEDMERLATSFEASVLNIVETVATSSATMRDRAVEFADAAQKTSEQATGVAATSNETSMNVRSVAVATEELSATVRNIAEQTGEARRLSEEANRHAEESVGIMASLDGTVRQIGDVVSVINQIAAQTNLLALNATIEAARAGEAGRGFAVVANEVKALASQTAKATDEISSKIQSVQLATSEAVRSIGQIGDAIPRISAASSVVAYAMNEQEKATREIAGNVELAALGVEDVTRIITDVAQIATGNGEAASEMLQAVEGLLSQSRSLRQEVTGFLADIRAA